MRDKFGQPKWCMDCGAKASMKGQSFLCLQCFENMNRQMKKRADSSIDPLPTKGKMLLDMEGQGKSLREIEEELNLSVFDIYKLRSDNNKLKREVRNDEKRQAHA